MTTQAKTRVNTGQTHQTERSDTFFEGKKAEETAPRKSTTKTLK
jgi:hypothetical protein